MQDRLLVIGGTGFIGSHLVKMAVNSGFKVIVVSLHAPIQEKKILDVVYIQADIRNLSQFKASLSSFEFEYIVNLSGYISHNTFLKGGSKIINSHFAGVQNILEIINWSILKRFVQIGSSDEYGSQPSPQNESLRESPITSYSSAKVASTHLLQMLAHTENFPVVILRLFLVYGPGQDDSRFLPQIIKGCFSGKDFETSLGEQLRDFCYVEDIVVGILLALKSDGINGEVINLASGDPISIRKVIKKIQAYIGQGRPQFGKIPYRAGENMSLYADISKAKVLLGWQPKTNIQIGIKKTVNSYHKNNQK